MPNPEPSRFRRALRAGLAVAAAALLGACGGGTSQIDPFVPTRLIAFGDELSVLDDSATPGNARKFTVNALNADKTAVDCVQDPLWIQALATSYSLVLPGCNPDGVATPPSRVYAAAGARVADVRAQITEHLANGGGFQGDVIVTVLVGANDILAAYGQYPGVSAEALVAQVEAAGEALGRQVIRISEEGGKVLVSTVPDLGLTPFAKAENASAGNSERSALLTRLVDRFNARMRVTLPADAGRSIGLVLADDLVRVVVNRPDTYSLTNVSDAACDATLAPSTLDCTTDTLVLENAQSVFVWADPYWLSPRLQALLGATAVSQSRRNPF